MKKASDKQVVEAARALREGTIVLFPTDTAYGLAVDADNVAAVESLYAFKERPEHKPIHVVVRDMEMAEQYVFLTPLATWLADRLLPGALTLVCAARPHVSPLLTANTGKLGIRIPEHPFTKQLSASFPRAYTATSANISGAQTPFSVAEAKLSLGERFNTLGCVVDDGVLPSTSVSTVVDVSGDRPVVLRVGAIPEERILRALVA